MSISEELQYSSTYSEGTVVSTKKFQAATDFASFLGRNNIVFE
jgi:hypothetical protein